MLDDVIAPDPAVHTEVSTELGQASGDNSRIRTYYMDNKPEDGLVADLFIIQSSFDGE